MYRDDIKNKIIVGMMDRLKKEITSLDFSFDPIALVFLSKNNFDKFLEIKKTSTASKIRFMFTMPKKKIDVRSDKLLANSDRLKAMLVNRTMQIKRGIKRKVSQRRLRSSFFNAVSLDKGMGHSSGILLLS